MHQFESQPIRRRDLLKLTAAGLPATLLTRGLLGAMSGDAPVKRLVCVGLDLSLRPENFFPTGNGPDYDVTELLKPVSKWRGRMSVFSQLDHPGVSGGHNAIQAYLSGVRPEQAIAAPHGILSVDQLAAHHIGHATRFPSLCLGVGGGDSISFTRAAIAVPKMMRPSDAFDQIFRPQPPSVREARQRSITTDRDVAALVLNDAKRLRSKLDHWDRQKLDEFQESLQEFEQGLKRSEVWLDRPYPTTDASPPNRTSDGCLDDVRAMYDLIALAFQCDASRVITLNIGHGLPVANKIPGVTQSYHDLSHTGKGDDKLRQLGIIEQKLMEEFDRFLGKLAELKDATGQSLLDQTVVLFGSGMGNASSHSNQNLPILVAGGHLKHGKHLFFEKAGRKQTPLCNLFVTLLQQLGIEIDRFGTSDGNLNELLV